MYLYGWGDLHVWLLDCQPFLATTPMMPVALIA